MYHSLTLIQLQLQIFPPLWVVIKCSDWIILFPITFSLINSGSNSGIFVNCSSFQLRKEVGEILLLKQFWIKMELITIAREEYNVPLCISVSKCQSHCAIFLGAVFIYWPCLNKVRLKALNKLILLFGSFKDSESQLVILLRSLPC